MVVSTSQQPGSNDSSGFHIKPERADPRLLRLAVEKVRAEKLVHAVLEVVPGLAMVVNEQRQIVAANRRFLDAVGARTLDDVVGKRPGDAVRCRNASKAIDGCGSSPSCLFCGAVQAVVHSQITQTPQTRECRIPLDDGRSGTVDAEVVASPVVIDGTSFTIVAMRDISAEKRRRVLERVFFHDVLNTAGGLRGLVSMLQEEPSPTADEEYVALLDDLCERLVEVIIQQRELLAAESGELSTHPMFVSVPSLLQTIKRLYERHDVAENRQVVLGDAPDVDVVTDMNLARRVLENMVKNALEASPPGATVTLDAEDLGEEVVLRVHNPGLIPEGTKHQIFQRSFSTKGTDRGIGTYSMRLFGEGYLGGEVGFTTSEERGTTFVFLIPKSWKGRSSDQAW
jgi:hypothetical protein